MITTRHHGKIKLHDTCFLQNKLRPRTHSIIRGYSLIVIQNLGSACGGKKYVTLYVTLTHYLHSLLQVDYDKIYIAALNNSYYYCYLLLLF